MDKAQLLSTFNERVDEFDRYQGFIDKAKDQVGKFAAAVVDKVIKDNEQRCLELVSEIIPLMTDMEQVLDDLKAQREAALDSARDSQFKLEELELRRAIGDLSEEDFNAEAAEFKAVVDSTDAKVAEFDEEATQFQAAVDQWVELGGRAGVLSDSPKPEPEPELDSGDAVDLEVDNLSDGSEVEFDDGGDDGFMVNDLDLLNPDEDLDIDDGAAESDDKPRRAVLLYQEGTAEEQIYPFTSEVMSLGRGRDNDVQVKNDSKVSRYHCKLYRRGPNFYIEDNKSANGTLVNGELITERRLFGGEEVIIGETFFRFRILD